MKIKVSLKIALVVLVALFITLFLIRLLTDKQLDDVSPLIDCDDDLLEKVDVYYIIPLYHGTGISEYNAWCSKTLLMDKELAMHGVYHENMEFATFRSASYVDMGKVEFKSCFGYDPNRFKPPQLEWNKENNWMKSELEIDLRLNQIFHKVYHCNDTGFFPNWLIDIF